MFDDRTVPNRTPFDEPTRRHDPVDAEPTRQALPAVPPQPAAQVVSVVPGREHKPARIVLPALGGVAGLVLLVIVGLASWIGLYRVNSWVMPGVTVGDVRLAGLTQQEAEAILIAEWQGAASITLADGARSWPVEPAAIGLALDPAATAERAYAVGRADGALGNAFLAIRGAIRGQPVGPVVAIDEEAARAGLETLAESAINTAPQNATIRVEQGAVIAVPGVDGATVDVEATLAALLTAPAETLLDGQLTVITVPIPPAVDDASGLVAEAEALLDGPLTLVAYDPIADEILTEAIAPETIAAWLVVEDGLRVEPGEMAEALGALDAALGAERGVDGPPETDAVREALAGSRRVTVRVTYSPTTYTVQPGDTLTSIAWDVGVPYWRIAEANPGINTDGLDVGNTLTIPAKTDLLPLPVVEGKRMLVDISDQRAWAYQDGDLWREFIISTGIDRSPTQPGVFQMQLFDEYAYAGNWDLYMPDFIGIYEAWPGFMNGFHGLPTLSSGVTLWADVLGQPASYGCIILDLDDSTALWQWAEPGIVVEIRE